ncbi:DUF2442 domain-containing protein [Paramagnetospirillum caucaseum]
MDRNPPRGIAGRLGPGGPRGSRIPYRTAALRPKTMHPDVITVDVLEGYALLLTFANGEKRIFSVEPYLDRGIFRELRDPAYFRSVRAISGFVSWPHEQDFSPDTLYLKSVPATLPKALP